MGLCYCSVYIFLRYVRCARGIVDYEIGGLDDLEPLLPESLHPGIVVGHGVLVEFAQRLFVACRMGGNVVSMKEIGSHEIVLLL